MRRRQYATIVHPRVLFAILTALTVLSSLSLFAQPSISNLTGPAGGRISQFEKVELSFSILDTSATNFQLPYDPAPPEGVMPGAGISVDAVFTDPKGRQHHQPAFLYQEFEYDFRDGRDWIYPTDRFSWRVRFSPDRTGQWSYRISARDAGGSAESRSYSFQVIASDEQGFVQVSERDSRYFEFEKGSLFTGLGVQYDLHLDDPVTKNAAAFEELEESGINLLRVWISSVYGSAWNPYVGGRNQYRGYLPVTGLVPFFNVASQTTQLAMRIDYEEEGDQGWFDACRLEWWNDPPAIKPGTSYRIRVRFRGIGIRGPRNSLESQYGLVLKLGGWHPDCYEPGTSSPVTTYGQNNADWGYIEGTWQSGTNNFLPRLHLALENVVEGRAYIDSISIRERRGDGRLGPEILPRPSMQYHLYTPQEKGFALDRVLQLAEQNDLYLKLVLMEKEDKIYLKMEDDGSFTAGGDNLDGFYGVGRTTNKTRWLQQAWWRYLQARWGYSSNIHSWELTNEGNPYSYRHYQLADEFGKFMRCRVFGVDPGEGDGQPCSYDHPNGHLVTTSFWHSLPEDQFWENSQYPNLDYADLHAYISTSYAPWSDKEKMQWDAAYYHIWHSQDVKSKGFTRPVVRGEAGMDSPNSQSATSLPLSRDRNGIWLHNYLWSGLDSGALYEVYWWNAHIWGGGWDHRKEYRRYADFLQDLPLNQGGYSDWGGTVSGEKLRVVGQKNTGNNRMHLWIQNSDHTWKNIVDEIEVPPASGEISVSGFSPGISFVLEWHDTYSGSITREVITSSTDGQVRIPIANLAQDVAILLHPAESVPDAPAAPRNLRALSTSSSE